MCPVQTGIRFASRSRDCTCMILKHCTWSHLPHTATATKNKLPFIFGSPKVSAYTFFFFCQTLKKRQHSASADTQTLKYISQKSLLHAIIYILGYVGYVFSTVHQPNTAPSANASSYAVSLHKYVSLTNFRHYYQNWIGWMYDRIGAKVVIVC